VDRGVETRLLVFVVFEVLLATPPPCPRRLEPATAPLALRPDVFKFVRALVCVEDGPARAEDEPFGF